MNCLCHSSNQLYSNPGPTHFHPSLINERPVDVKLTSVWRSTMLTLSLSSDRKATAIPSLCNRTKLSTPFWKSLCEPAFEKSTSVIVNSHSNCGGNHGNSQNGLWPQNESKVNFIFRSFTLSPDFVKKSCQNILFPFDDRRFYPCVTFYPFHRSRVVRR